MVTIIPQTKKVNRIFEQTQSGITIHECVETHSDVVSKICKSLLFEYFLLITQPELSIVLPDARTLYWWTYGDMKIHIIRQRATEEQIQAMMEQLETYIKVAIDVERGILAGGGEYHADCEEILLEDGSRQEDLWGADWYQDSHTVGFSALINIRPAEGNRGMEIENPELRQKVEKIVRRLLEVNSK